MEHITSVSDIPLPGEAFAAMKNEMAEESSQNVDDDITTKVSDVETNPNISLNDDIKMKTLPEKDDNLLNEINSGDTIIEQKQELKLDIVEALTEEINKLHNENIDNISNIDMPVLESSNDAQSLDSSENIQSTHIVPEPTQTIAENIDLPVSVPENTATESAPETTATETVAENTATEIVDNLPAKIETEITISENLTNESVTEMNIDESDGKVSLDSSAELNEIISDNKDESEKLEEANLKEDLKQNLETEDASNKSENNETVEDSIEITEIESKTGTGDFPSTESTTKEGEEIGSVVAEESSVIIEEEDEMDKLEITEDEKIDSKIDDEEKIDNCAKKTKRINSTIEAIKNDWNDVTIEELKEESPAIVSTSPEAIPIIEQPAEEKISEEKSMENAEKLDDTDENITEVIILETTDENYTLATSGNDNIIGIIELDLEKIQESDSIIIDKVEKHAAITVANEAEEKSEENINKDVSEIIVTEESKEDNSETKTETTSSPIKETRSKTKQQHIKEEQQQQDEKKLEVKVPCHVLGRNVDNPTEDLISNGRTPPKPRLGVKVPYRFLTSQIVSKQDIADELLERVAKRNVDVDPPAGGDIFFAKKLTQRLASKIAQNESKRIKQQEDLKKQKSESGIPEDALTTTPEKTVSTAGTSKTITDNSDLLAILEGDVDVDLTKEVRKTKTNKESIAALPVLSPEITTKLNKSATDGPNWKSLDPEMERKLALKQLKEMPKKDSRRGRKPLYHRIQEPPVSTRVSRSQTQEQQQEKVQQKVPKIEQKSPPKVVDKPVSEDVKQAAEIVLEKIKEKKLTKSDLKFVDDLENDLSLTPKRVTKTYSRKEAVLDVPEELENLVNEINSSALNDEKMEEKSAEKENEDKPKKTDDNKDERSGKKSQMKRAKRSIEEINKPEVTLVSKRARIIKRKVIWDPAEAQSSRVKKNIISTKLQSKAKDKPEKQLKKLEEKPKKPEEKLAAVNKDNIANGETELRTRNIRGKILSKAALNKVQQVKKLLMKRQLRTVHSGKIKKSSNGELKSSIALARKKKQIAKEIAKTMKPKRTELDRLLMDEGAVNMLYSVRTENRKQRMPQNRKDLLNRTKMVKDTITQSRIQEESPKLRKKDSAKIEKLELPQRKKSRDSLRSSLASPPPSPSYIFPHRAEASRIIRRHSSSFSSECSSPRRLSVDQQQDGKKDADKVGEQQTENKEIKDDGPKKNTEKPEFQSPVRILRRKGVPIFERKPEEKTYKGKKKLLSEVEGNKKENDNETQKPEQQQQQQQKADNKVVEKEKLSVAEKRKLNTEMTKNFEKLSPTPPKKRTRSSTKDECKEKETTTVEVVVADEKQQPGITTRQITMNTTYKEITLKKIDNLVQIILTPTSTKLKSTINLQLLNELCEVLTQLGTDNTCNVVLLTSADSRYFCHGVDFSVLIQTNNEKRQTIAQDMAKTLQTFLRILAKFPKPLIAGVQGSAIGLGVTMLALFDLVFASDKATFSTPYGRLGQVPEGLATITLPHLLGNTLTSELMFSNRKVTASEALNYGLVTRTLWLDKFQEELISNALAIAGQSLQSMMATKSLIRQPILSRLEDALETEYKLLVEHWTSSECQQNFKKLLQEDDWC